MTGYKIALRIQPVRVLYYFRVGSSRTWRNGGSKQLGIIDCYQMCLPLDNGLLAQHKESWLL